MLPLLQAAASSSDESLEFDGPSPIRKNSMDSQHSDTENNILSSCEKVPQLDELVSDLSIRTSENCVELMSPPENGPSMLTEETDSVLDESAFFSDMNSSPENHAAEVQPGNTSDLMTSDSQIDDVHASLGSNSADQSDTTYFSCMTTNHTNKDISISNESSANYKLETTVDEPSSNSCPTAQNTSVSSVNSDIMPKFDCTMDEVEYMMQKAASSAVCVEIEMPKPVSDYESEDESMVSTKKLQTRYLSNPDVRKPPPLTKSSSLPNIDKTPFKKPDARKIPVSSKSCRKPTRLPVPSIKLTCPTPDKNSLIPIKVEKKTPVKKQISHSQGSASKFKMPTSCSPKMKKSSSPRYKKPHGAVAKCLPFMSNYDYIASPIKSYIHDNPPPPLIVKSSGGHFLDKTTIEPVKSQENKENKKFPSIPVTFKELPAANIKLPSPTTAQVFPKTPGSELKINQLIGKTPITSVLRHKGK